MREMNGAGIIGRRFWWWEGWLIVTFRVEAGMCEMRQQPWHQRETWQGSAQARF